MAVSAETETTHPKDLLRIADLDREELGYLLDLAAYMKRKPKKWRKAQRGKVLACYFTKPSTRTRVSLEAAAYRLGMLPVMLRPDELQLGRGEPISDTARVLSSYVDALAIRTFADDDVAEVARNASIPVVNALTDGHHPCQALADLLTLRERFERLEGLKLAYIGDGNNVAHSLIEAGARADMHVVIACPPGYEPDDDVVEGARSIGGTIEVVSDPREAVHGAQAVYTDAWVSMGEDEEREERLARLRDYQVSPELMGEAVHEAVFMHCLPAHRGEEVTAEVIDGSQSVVFPQAENRLHTEQAVIQTLVSGYWDGVA